MEQWILHKLNIAVGEVNAQLADRNFMMATTAAHNFWLYELCDVYIVSPPELTYSRYCGSSVFFFFAGSDENHDG